MIRFIAVVASILIIAIGCSPRRDEPLVGPLGSNDSRVGLGERVFAWNCYECHPGGRGSVGFALNNKPLPGPMIKTQVRLGAGAMPAFTKDQISDEELEAVVRYMVALRSK
jgi:mono/diheme cytochrome c family protein